MGTGKWGIVKNMVAKGNEEWKGGRGGGGERLYKPELEKGERKRERMSKCGLRK